ncbi:hypothetical protein [Vibrio diazotrophicus]|uniref:hypothetical protein n=1 Tax=Vibrio diazotrophicus TaxID=685 RepID=UPI00142DA2FE|nr:hypothetical protein [Vibrio diazotrophicus]NIY94219.1 hypothetical protein [Vibrio diazotrophicus]
MIFNDKHVFLITDRDKFLYLHLHTLIENNVLRKEDLIIIVLPSKKNECYFVNLSKLSGLKYLKYNDDLLSDITESRSLTVMSLSSINSDYVMKIIDKKNSFRKKIAIYITDDEVERWVLSKKKYGNISEDYSLLISKSTLDSLAVINNFMAPNIPFKRVLTDVLGRKVNIIDACAVFNIMSNYSYEEMLKIENNIKDNSSTKILFSSKSIGYKKILHLFFLCKKISKAEGLFDIFIFIENKRVSLFFYFVSTLVLVFFRNVRITNFRHCNPLFYLSIVLSCHCFVLQNRGGGSTAIQYIKLKAGRVFVRDRSPNMEILSKYFELKLSAFNSINDLASQIIKKEDSVDLSYNEQCINKKINNSFKNLKSYYTSI